MSRIGWGDGGGRYKPYRLVGGTQTDVGGTGRIGEVLQLFVMISSVFKCFHYVFDVVCFLLL